VLYWLVPVAVFWSVASTYLGGASLKIEGGGAGRQMSGLLLLFVSFLVVYRVFGMILPGIIGAGLGTIPIPLALTIIAMPFLAKATFKVAGVSITRVPPGGAH
jgi:hypothetical protein